MFKHFLGRLLHVIVLSSLLLSSCGPIVNADLSSSSLSLPSNKEYPKYQPSDYQAPVFEHQEPRTAQRSLEETQKVSTNLDSTTEEFLGSDSATEQISISYSGGDGNGPSTVGGSSLSADGRFVAFASIANNLVVGDTNGKSDIFVFDRQTRTMTRVSVSSSGVEGNDDSCTGPGYEAVRRCVSISADGRYVVFDSSATNLTSRYTLDQSQIYVHDMQTGVTSLVSAAPDPYFGGNGDSHHPVISANGRYVAFESEASNLVAIGGVLNSTQVFVRDLQAGTTIAVSVNISGEFTPSAWIFNNSPSISADGRYVVFESNATDLVAGDTGSNEDIFLRDLQTNTTTLVSVSSSGEQGNGPSYFKYINHGTGQSISADGRYVVFFSPATNLADGANNGESHIFVRDIQTSSTTYIPTPTGYYYPWMPSISGNGRIVGFYAGDWPDGFTSNGSLFTYVLDTGTTTLISDYTEYPSPGWAPALSYDGQVVAFVKGINLDLDVFVHGQAASVLPDSTTYSSNLGLDGHISCIAVCSQGHEGGPINTRTGGYDYSATDISIQTSAGPLTFERSYTSLARNIYSTNLGYGWAHNHDMYLSIGAYDGNGQRELKLKGHTANQYSFTQTSGLLTTVAEPGVYATLAQGPSSFILTDKSQSTYEFNLTTGQLISYTNPNGKKLLYTFDAKGRLTRIADETGQRYLTLACSGNDKKIRSVTDHNGRSAVFTYDGNANLVSAKDVLNKTWTYQYDTSHRMTHVIDPASAIVERTEYDANGRAWRQFDGMGNLVVELTYNADGTTTIKDANDNTKTDGYNYRKVRTTTTDQTGGTVAQSYDANFRPNIITDASQNPTSLTWSADGADLTQIKDAKGGQVDLTYDSLHNLKTVIDQRDFLTTYEYNGTKLTSVLDALNGTTSYTYTPEGFIESMTDPENHTTYYTYNTQGQRISMTDPLQNTWHYTYDNLGRLVDTTDPLQRVTHNEYDTAGRLIKVTRNYDVARPQNDENQYNIVTKYQYDDRGNQTAVIDTYGRATQYVYDNAGRLIQTIDFENNTTINTYDPAGNLITVKDPLNRTTTYTYDEAGRVIAVIDAKNHTTRTSYNPDGTVHTTTDALNNVTTYEYNELKQVIRVIDANGKITYNEYDEAGNLIAITDPRNNTTRFQYDALGRLIKEIDPLLGETEYFYYKTGNLKQKIDPRNNATTYTYDEANRLITVADARGKVNSYEYDDAGRRIAMIDPRLKRTEYTYDVLDRVIAVTDPLLHTSYTTYDAMGNVLSRTDANGKSTSYEYDTLYRLTSQTDPMDGTIYFTYDAIGNQLTVKDGNEHITRTTYDSLNRPETVTDPNENTTTTVYDEVGNVASIIDPLQNTTHFGYDSLNRQISVTDPLNNVTRYTYDEAGNSISMTDANDIVTRFEYDEMGRLIAVVENYQAGVTPDAQTNVRTEYSYDENGNRRTILDGNNHTTTFIYDELNRLVQEIDALGNTWTYTYDDAGNLLSLTDANLAVTQYTYDDNNRLIGIDYPSPDADVSFVYDPAGRRTTMTDGLGTTSWTYDDLNRPISITDPFNKTVGYGYDATGNRTSLTYPDTQSVTYTYDAANRLVSASGLSSNVQYNYDDANRLTGVSRPNGVDSVYTYDSSNRLLSLMHTAGGQNMAAYQYIYDAVGNRTQAIEDISFPAGSLPPATLTAIAGATQTFTQTPTSTSTFTPSATATETATPTSTSTQTDTPTSTPTATNSPTPTATFTQSPYPTIVDNFDGSLLDPAWEWYVPVPGPRYSLSEEPGSLRLNVSQGRDHWVGYDNAPQVRRKDMGSGDWAIETHLALGDTNAGDQWQVNLMVGFDRYDQQWLSIGNDGNVRVTRVGNSDTASQAGLSLPIYLRIEKSGGQYTFKYKENDVDPWTTLDVQTISTAVQYVGLQFRTYGTNPGDTVFDVDYFRMEPAGPPDPEPEKQVVIDEFDLASLGQDWIWYVPKSGPTYSLSAVSDAFRMILPAGNSFEHWGTTDEAPQLRRADLGDGDWAIETRLENIDAVGAGYWAALEVGFNQIEQLWYGMVDDGNLKSVRVNGCCIYFQTPESLPVILRLEKHGQEYVFKYRYNPDEAWTVMAPQVFSETPAYVGLIGRAFNTGTQEMHLDWSYFRLERWAASGTQMTVPDGSENGLNEAQLPDSSEDPLITSTPTQKPTITPSPTQSQTPPLSLMPALPLTPSPEGLGMGGIYFVSYPRAPKTSTFTPTLEPPTPTASLTPTVAGATDTPTNSPTATDSPTPVPSPVLQTVIIDYTYDPLYRLTTADYSSGEFYHYTYDPVGNRITQQSHLNSDSYVYDNANRLTSVNGITYTWDANGNLLNDGTNTYAYDSANQLKSITGASSATFSYNGLGDRLTQNGVQYTLDLNAGLTQILEDGTNTYLYGLGRIAEKQGNATEYYLGDALGSVRQLTNNYAEVTLTRSYEPFGKTAQSVGTAQTDTGFTGEFTDSYIKLIYLRSRWYDPASGRFPTRDSWQGDYHRPLSLNRWNYVEANPINYVDPTGFIKQSEIVDADKIVKELKTYRVFLQADWGTDDFYWPDPILHRNCGWIEGEWYLNELVEIRKGVLDLARAMGGLNKFIFNLGYVKIKKGTLTNPDWIATGGLHSITVNNNQHTITRWFTVHELAHAWDQNFGGGLSVDLETVTGGFTDPAGQDPWFRRDYCPKHKNEPGCNKAGYYYGDIPAYYSSSNHFNRGEDFAYSVSAYVYPDRANSLVNRYKNTKNSYHFLYYPDFRNTLRWTYIHNLMQSIQKAYKQNRE